MNTNAFSESDVCCYVGMQSPGLVYDWRRLDVPLQNLGGISKETGRSSQDVRLHGESQLLARHPKLCSTW